MDASHFPGPAEAESGWRERIARLAELDELEWRLDATRVTIFERGTDPVLPLDDVPGGDVPVPSDDEPGLASTGVAPDATDREPLPVGITPPTPANVSTSPPTDEGLLLRGGRSDEDVVHAGGPAPVAPACPTAPVDHGASGGLAAPGGQGAEPPDAPASAPATQHPPGPQPPASPFTGGTASLTEVPHRIQAIVFHHHFRRNVAKARLISGGRQRRRRKIDLDLTKLADGEWERLLGLMFESVALELEVAAIRKDGRTLRSRVSVLGVIGLVPPYQVRLPL